MTFDTIPAGLPVFLDANCLVYEATADPTYGPACKRLLERLGALASLDADFDRVPGITRYAPV